MLDNWNERDDVVAAGSICPVPDCGALVVSYGPPEYTGPDNSRSWCEFACPHCWNAATPNGLWVYVSNAASSTISIPPRSVRKLASESAYQQGHGNRYVENSSNPFECCQYAGFAAKRDDIAVANRRERYKAE